MSKPKVSVIMGIYNGEKTMRRAIDSIIEQTFTDWELVVCDDCSTDKTLEILSEYAEKDERIKVVRNEKNLRLAATLNHCLKEAKGEYIARMDADDICLPERFEKQVKYLDVHPEMAVVGTGCIIFDENGDKLVRGIGCEYPLKKVVNKSTPFMHVTIMMRKSAYDLLEGYRVCPETMRAEDLDLWYRFRMAKLDGYVIQEPLVKVCEALEDFKRRTVKAAWGMVKINKKYHRLLKIPFKYRWYIYKPLISALLPNRLMAWYHKKK